MWFRIAFFQVIIFFLSEFAGAVCSAPSGSAGKIIYNTDYHVAQYCDGSQWIAMGAKRTGADTLNFITSNSVNSTFADAVWGDGTYLYVADYTGGIDAYKFNSTTLSYLASETTHSNVGASSIWGDGSYIYVADLAGGLDAYSFNGTAFTYIATNTTNTTMAEKVWGDGTYIYVADATGGIDAYTFNGTAFTFKATDTADITWAYAVWGDGTFIYVADAGGGLDVYSFNGTAFTLKASDSTYSANQVWGDGTYIYTIGGTRITAYTVHPTTGAITIKATNTTAINSGQSIGGDQSNIYVVDNNGSGIQRLDVLTFDGTTFTKKTQATYTSISNVWADGSFVYTTNGSGGVAVYNRYLHCANPTNVRGSLVYNPDWRVLQVCDGLYWNAAGPQKRTFSPAVVFDGTNDYLLRGGDLTGSADSKMVTGSFWFRNRVAGTGGMIYCAIDTAGSCRFSIRVSSTFQLLGRGTGGGTLIVDASGGTSIMDTDWHHIMFSIDLSNTAKRYVYLDGALNSIPWTTYTDAVIDFTRTEHSVGAFTNGNIKFDGDIDDLWINLGAYMDLSDAANRAKFRDASGNPVDLGATGEKPTGSAPEVYLSSRGGGLAGFATNKGTGGGFTLTGALTESKAPLASLACTHLFPAFIPTSTANSPAPKSIWGDGSYLYVADGSGGGLDVYSFNGTSFTFKATDTVHSTDARDVWGDGSYIYVANNSGGIVVYQFDGTNLTYKTSNSTNSTISYGVWGGGGYIYIADYSGIDAYTFNGTTLTFKGTKALTAGVYDVWADSNYVYVADYTSGIAVLTFNGTTFTTVASNGTNSTNSWSIRGDGSYIYVGEDTHFDVYTFNGTSLTYKMSSPTGSARHVWPQAGNVYSINQTNGLDAYSFDGNAIKLKGRNDLNTFFGDEIWGDGTFIFVPDSGGIDVYKGEQSLCICSNPVGKEGELKFNTNFSALQYCNGQNWIKIGK
jgi:hypothetical protein